MAEKVRKGITPGGRRYSSVRNDKGKAVKKATWVEGSRGRVLFDKTTSAITGKVLKETSKPGDALSFKTIKKGPTKPLKKK